MSSAQISVSFYGIRVQRVVIPNMRKPQLTKNSNIKNSPLNFEY